MSAGIAMAASQTAVGVFKYSRRRSLVGRHHLAENAEELGMTRPGTPSSAGHGYVGGVDAREAKRQQQARKQARQRAKRKAAALSGVLDAGSTDGESSEEEDGVTGFDDGRYGLFDAGAPCIILQLFG